MNNAIGAEEVAQKAGFACFFCVLEKRYRLQRYVFFQIREYEFHESIIEPVGMKSKEQTAFSQSVLSKRFPMQGTVCLSAR